MRRQLNKCGKNKMKASQEFIVKKRYIGYPSKTTTTHEGNFESCKNHIEMMYYITRKNGGDIDSYSETNLTVLDYDSNGATVEFNIEEK